MLLYDLIEKCADRDNFQSNHHEKCADCSYGTQCPGDCQICLKYIHFPLSAPMPRKYDCTHMADCYYCKYAFKYASEIVYGLEQFVDLQYQKSLKVMSVGCGPCTDLAAVDYLREAGVFHFEKLIYWGIDPLAHVWHHIWEDIHNYYGSGIHFYQYDILKDFDILLNEGCFPDVLIFQYVFSDMYKSANEQEILQFIGKLTHFLNSYAEKPIYILCNDINLSISFGDCRELFDLLSNGINEPKIVRRMHFDNSNKQSHFEYGEQYPNNKLIFSEIPCEVRRVYNPFDSCASAQILIKRDII